MKKVAFFLGFLMLGASVALATQGAWERAFKAQNNFAEKVETIKPTLQIAMDYDSRTDGQPVYLGYASRSEGTDSGEWLVYKFTYDGNDQLLTRKSAFGAYDDRASLTYE